MSFGLNEDLLAIEESVGKICDQFGDEYWAQCDEEHKFPIEFHQAMAQGGWLGVAMPEEIGGSALGLQAAAVMMHRVAYGPGGYNAACALHINLFGPSPVAKFGTAEQKERMLKPIMEGRHRVCFGVTEPNAGLDTSRIQTVATKVDGGYRVTGRKLWTSGAHFADKILLITRTTPRDDARPTDGMTMFFTDMDRSKIEVRPIPKMGRNAIASNAIFIDDFFVPDSDRIGDEGKGFKYLIHGLNSERVLVAMEGIGLGREALRRASAYARERVVFNRPIGMNQGIQHPLAECWTYLESAYWTAMRAAALSDADQPCGAEANAAKFLAGRAAVNACTQAMMTHGGMGYAREYHVERLFREAMLVRLTPVTEQMILSFIAEKVLGQPKSY